MVLNLSCPAVSQTCNLIFLPLLSMVLILKSIPIVVMNDGLNLSSTNLNNKQDFPTPESPTNNNFMIMSYDLDGAALPLIMCAVVCVFARWSEWMGFKLVWHARQPNVGSCGGKIASFKLPARRSRYDTDHRRNDKNDKRAGVDAEHSIISLCYWSSIQSVGTRAIFTFCGAHYSTLS